MLKVYLYCYLVASSKGETNDYTNTYFMYNHMSFISKDHLSEFIKTGKLKHFYSGPQLLYYSASVLFCFFKNPVQYL